MNFRHSAILFALCGSILSLRALDISIGTVRVRAGTNAHLAITFSNAPVQPISAFALYLTSTNAFGVPSIAPGSARSNLVCFVDSFSNSVWRVTGFVLDAPSISNGHVATLTFNVPPDTTPGVYPVAFTAASPLDAPPAPNPEARSLITSERISGVAYGGFIDVLIPGAPASITSISTQPGNIFLLQFAGTAGASYTIEAATNLLAPVPWLPLTNLSADGSGLFEFIELDAANYSNRFFRVVHP